MQWRMCPIRVFVYSVESFLGEWLESCGWNLYIIWDQPFPTSRGPSLPVCLTLLLCGWWARSASAHWLSVFKETWKSTTLFPHKLTDASLNLPSVTLPPCLLLWFPCLPFSSFILSFHTYRHATVTPLSDVHQRCPIKKAGPHLFGDH